MRSSISINFAALFPRSPCMVFKALSIPQNSRISRLAFCDASRVLTLTSSATSAKDEISINRILSISMLVGNSDPSLVVALKDRYNACGVSSMPRKFIIA